MKNQQRHGFHQLAFYCVGRRGRGNGGGGEAGSAKTPRYTQCWVRRYKHEASVCLLAFRPEVHSVLGEIKV